MILTETRVAKIKKVISNFWLAVILYISQFNSSGAAVFFRTFRYNFFIQITLQVTFAVYHQAVLGSERVAINYITEVAIRICRYPKRLNTRNQTCFAIQIEFVLCICNV